jgi:drug/metabolite transporter (DMT)-like permease
VENWLEAALGAGLAAAIAWGLASYLSALAARQFGGWITNVGALVATVLVLVPLGLVALGGAPAQPTLVDVAVIAAVGIGALVLDVALFQLLTVAPVAIVFPIISASGAVVAALAIWLLGETLLPLQLAGVVAITAGVAAIAYRRPGSQDPDPVADETLAGGTVFVRGPQRSAGPVPRQAAARVVPIAIAITILAGVLLFIIALFTRRLGWYQPLIIDRLAQAFFVIAVLAAGYPPRRDLAGHGLRWWLVLAVIGVLNAAAVSAYWLGIATSSAAITATVAATFAAVPVLLGIVLLRERPQRHQVAGIVAVLAGIVALAAA